LTTKRKHKIDGDTMSEKKYIVKVSHKAEKMIKKIPQREKILFRALIIDLEESGPYRTEWPNYSSLGKDQYHCHLSYHWVACWTWEKGSIIIEVYYAGSRQKAPY